MEENREEWAKSVARLVAIEKQLRYDAGMKLTNYLNSKVLSLTDRGYNTKSLFNPDKNCITVTLSKDGIREHVDIYPNDECTHTLKRLEDAAASIEATRKADGIKP